MQSDQALKKHRQPDLSIRTFFAANIYVHVRVHVYVSLITTV